PCRSPGEHRGRMTCRSALPFVASVIQTSIRCVPNGPARSTPASPGMKSSGVSPRSAALSLSGGQLFHRFQATAFEMQVEADRARARLEVELENLALQPRVAGPDGAGAHPASRNHLLEF